MSPVATIPSAVKSGLNDQEVETRLAAVEKLAQLKELPEPPFDEMLELLRERAGTDDDRDVRNAAYEAKRPVAIARGKRRGLRNPRPNTMDMAKFGDRELVWKAIEIVWDAVSIYDGPEMLDAGLKLATRGQTALYAVWWTQSEVRNGGFYQYFDNPTGIVVEYARDGFKYIGANDLASVVERAMSRFPKGHPPLEQAVRRRALQKLGPKPLDGIDDEFYRHTDSLFSLGAKCVRDNLGDFFELP